MPGISPVLRWHPSISRKFSHLCTNGNGLNLPDAANLQIALRGGLSESDSTHIVHDMDTVHQDTLH